MSCNKFWLSALVVPLNWQYFATTLFFFRQHLVLQFLPKWDIVLYHSDSFPSVHSFPHADGCGREWKTEWSQWQIYSFQSIKCLMCVVCENRKKNITKYSSVCQSTLSGSSRSESLAPSCWLHSFSLFFCSYQKWLKGRNRCFSVFRLRRNIEKHLDPSADPSWPEWNVSFVLFLLLMGSEGVLQVSEENW